MGWRVGSAMLLAALLAGCADNRLFHAPQAQSDYAMATPAQADPTFRVNELRPGLSKAELQAMYPGRLAFDSGDARNELYFVEPLGVAPQARTPRDRLVLWFNDGRLATYEVLHTEEPVAVAVAASAPAPAATRPVGKFAVQIAARRSEADARAAIDQMRAKFPSLLTHEWASINRVSLPQGVFYRVMIGPLASAQQAAQLCNSLRSQGAECFIRGT
jgi:hypothetical protein